MADPAADTLAARLARVARDCRHCPPEELPMRAPVALGAHGLAVVASSQRLYHPEGVRRPLVQVTLTVRDVAEAHAPVTFEGLAEYHPADQAAVPLGRAIVQALMALWIAALGVDLYSPAQALPYDQDPTAWERHLAALRTDQEVRGSWQKHRPTFADAAVLFARRAAAIDAVVRIRSGHALTATATQILAWLDADPTATQPRQRARDGAPT